MLVWLLRVCLFVFMCDVVCGREEIKVALNMRVCVCVCVFTVRLNNRLSLSLSLSLFISVCPPWRSILSVLTLLGLDLSHSAVCVCVCVWCAREGL